RPNRSNDAGRDLILQSKDVFERAFKALRPNVRRRVRVDQLPRNAYSITGFSQAAFEYVAHAEFAADLLDVYGSVFVGEARVARDDEEPPDTRERGDDVLDDAVGKVLLLGVAAQVVER